MRATAVRKEIQDETDKTSRKVKNDIFCSYPSQYLLAQRRPGGYRIYGVFDNQLPAALRRLPFDRHLSMQNVRRVVSEADGYQPHLIAPEQGYHRLIEESLNYFTGPAEVSVDAELRRFPTLQSEIAAAANEALERFRDESKKAALRLVDMESSYLTVDLFRRLSQEVEKPVGPGGKPGNPGGYPAANAAVDRYLEGQFQRIGSNMSSYVRMVSERLRNMIPKAVVHCQVREAKMSLLNHFYLERERLSLSLSLNTHKHTLLELIDF